MIFFLLAYSNRDWLNVCIQHCHQEFIWKPWTLMTLFSSAWAQTDWLKSCFYTGYSLSEALILASINPKYDNRMFMKIVSSEYLQNMLCTQIAVFVLTFRTILVHNMFCRCCELLKKIYLYTWLKTSQPTWPYGAIG